MKQALSRYPDTFIETWGSGKDSTVPFKALQDRPLDRQVCPPHPDNASLPSIHVASGVVSGKGVSYKGDLIQGLELGWVRAGKPGVSVPFSLVFTS